MSIRSQHIENLSALNQYYAGLRKNEPIAEDRQIQLYLLFSYQTFLLMTVKQRLNALRLLEQHFAHLQKRPPCPIRLSGHPGFYGAFLSADYCIEMNRNTIYQVSDTTLQDGNFHPGAVLHLVHTILHEGFHAYQYLKVHSSSCTSFQEKEWFVNTFGVYLDDPENFDSYYTQPLERDANLFAHEQLTEILETIEFFNGPEPELCRKEMIQYSPLHFRRKIQSLYGWYPKQLLQDRKQMHFACRQNIGSPFTEAEQKEWLSLSWKPDLRLPDFS